MPLISVIVPVYKVEPYLRECVDSILNQTFTDFELILVDDGSPDNCPAICDEYAKKDNRVIVIHKENGGLSSARNSGIDYAYEKSNSFYIAFVDGDDCVSPLFLEVLIKNCESSGADISMCLFDHLIDSKLSISPSNQTKNELSRSKYWSCGLNDANYTVVWNKLYKKNIFNIIRFPVGKICEDELTIHYIIDLSKKIIVTDLQLYHYRIRNDSIISCASKEKKNIIFLTSLNSRLELFFKSPEYSSIIPALINKIICVFKKSLYDSNNGLYRKKILSLRQDTIRILSDHKIKKPAFFSLISYFFWFNSFGFFVRRIIVRICILFAKLWKRMQIAFFWEKYKYFYRKPSIMSKEETIKFIINNKVSVSRFGDGEYSLIFKKRKNIGFQNLNESISKDLLLSFNSNSRDMLVCISDFLDEKKLNNLYGKWLKEYVYNNYKDIDKIINYNYVYGNANFTRFYHPDLWKTTNRSYLINEYVPLIKSIWNNLNILIVEGKDSKLGVGNDLFENAASVRRIVCPSSNAYNKKQEIITAIKDNHNNKDLILLALGPTASVLATEITSLFGWWCIDIGHIDVVYMWLLNHSKTKDDIEGKNVNEKRNNSLVIKVKYDVEKYLNEVISVID